MNKEEAMNEVTEHLINVITSSEILIYEIDKLKEFPDLYSGGLKTALKQSYNQLLRYTKKVYDFVGTEEGANIQFSALYSNHSEILHLLARMSTKDRIDVNAYIKYNYEIREKSMGA